MENHIREMSVRQSRLDPAEAELGITVYPDQVTSTTQVRGRLMGPRCRYASTVEVAYSLREWSRQYEKEGPPHIFSRVIIPEPCFWEPECPHLYEGPVELWQKDQLCEQAEIRHGLRVWSLGPHGLRWNGRLLPLRGMARSPSSEREALAWHQAGCNSLLIPAEAATEALWNVTDALGFLVFVRVAQKSDLPPLRLRQRHPSFLGWVLDAKMLEDPVVTAVLTVYPANEGQLLGIALSRVPSGGLPDGIRFVVFEESLLPALTEIRLPKLVLKDAPFTDQGSAGQAVGSGTILGWVYN